MSLFDNLTVKLTVAGCTTSAMYGVYRGCRLAANALTTRNKVAAAALILVGLNVLTGVGLFVKPQEKKIGSFAPRHQSDSMYAYWCACKVKKSSTIGKVFNTAGCLLCLVPEILFTGGTEPLDE